MASYQDREAFIPYSRQEIIELCLADEQIEIADRQDFQEFCTILAAYYHFKLHRSLEDLKANFVPFNPDLDRSRANNKPRDHAQIQQQENDLVKTFTTILQQANYYPISRVTLQKALEAGSMFDLKTEVDFDDFEQMICYARGDRSETVTLKKMFFSTETKEIEIYQRVVLLIKFKATQHFQDKPVAEAKLKFKPGKTYLYLYKNLSKLDIEFIFPNIKMSMNWKDRLLFGVPAIGAAVPLMLKIIPQIILVIGVIIYLTLGHQPIDNLQVKEEDVRNITPLLIAIMSLIITLGGFAFRQYTTYKNKQIKFQKSITETLFYRNIANNSGVFKYLIDAAEEEECKEIILVYYHLLVSKQPLSANQLDDRIEAWLEKKSDTKIDFNIDKPLQNLAEIKTEIVNNTNSAYSIKQASLLKCVQPTGIGNFNNIRYDVLPIKEAKQTIDRVWDNLFQYS